MTDATVAIRPMTSGDVDRVIQIAESLPHAPQWKREAYEAALVPMNEPRRVALVAVGPDKLITGFAISLLVGPEAELETIAVAAERQRAGVGKVLLNALTTTLRQAGVTKVLLEVRDSNWAAQQLYRSNGFKEIGRRSGYYIDPKEDAVLLVRLMERSV